MADKSYRGYFTQAVEDKHLAFEVAAREEGQKGFVAAAARWKLKGGSWKGRLPG